MKEKVIKTIDALLQDMPYTTVVAVLKTIKALKEEKHERKNHRITK